MLIGILLGIMMAACLAFLIVVWLFGYFNDMGNSTSKIDDFSRGIRVLSKKNKMQGQNIPVAQRAEIYKREYRSGKFVK